MKNTITSPLLFLFRFFIRNATQLLLVICISGNIFTSCKFSKEKGKMDDTSKETTALHVVENAIDSAGTLEKWQSIASLEYTKTTRLFLENGQIESETTQRHHYVFRPKKSIKIAWVIQRDSFLVVHNDSISRKFKNDSLIEQGATVKSTVNSAMYVLGMPFKLLDQGTILTYEGLKTISATDTVHTIKATYEPRKHSNHSTKDVWWYHFDKNNGTFLSSMVYHEPTYALIENEFMTKEGGLTFPRRRKSYRCNKFGEKQFLRGEFHYEDYSITFLNEENFAKRQ